jgi:ketoreductase RED2
MKTAIVTGATLGVGKGIVDKLCALDYKVIATSRNPENLNGVWGKNVLVEHLDLREKEGIQKLYHKYKDTQIDLIVNNAAGGSYHHGEDLYDTFIKAHSINVIGPALLNKLFSQNLSNSENPLVVLISSFAGKYPYVGDMTYCNSKAAVSSLAEILRMEYAPGLKIRVTEIRPSSINTRESHFREKEFSMSVEDIADAIVWVAEMPRYCNIDLIEMSPLFAKKYL